VEILIKVGIKEDKCDVWEVKNSEARLLIATLNRLEGQDMPELRISLLKNLMDDYDPSELESLIPENTKQLEDMIELWREDFEAVQKQIEESTSRFECEIQDMRIMDFFLNSEQYQLIVKTLDEVKDSSCLKDRNEALYELAKYHKSDDRMSA
jgi:predicted component of type VI protein secretion system